MHAFFSESHEAQKAHFPDYFNDLCSSISVAYKGEVFLVAAGFLGKIYCNIIKEQGGIALDIGSAADYWLNYNTRQAVCFDNLVEATPSISHIT